MAAPLADVLNEHERACADARETLRHASDRAHSPSLRSTFEQQANFFEECCESLQGLVIQLDETPAQSGTSAGAVRRGIAALRDTFTTADDEALLGDCRASIDHVAALYRAALSTVNPDPINALLARQYLQIDQIRADFASYATAFAEPVG